MPMSNICKRVALVRVVQTSSKEKHKLTNGPFSLIIRSLSEYKLLEKVITSVSTGLYCSLTEWKTIVKFRVNEVEGNRWLAHVGMYRKLVLFRQCTFRHVWPWWVFLQHNPAFHAHCKTLLRLMTGEHGLGSNTGLWHGCNISSICVLCDAYRTEDVTHALVQCEWSSDAMVGVWSDIRRVAPQGLVHEMENLGPDDLISFWLSGFKCTYIPEWVELYCIVCIYKWLVSK